MQVFKGVDSIILKEPVFVAIGNFDGVHAGHRKLIQRLCEEARAHRACSVVLIFDPHPIKVLYPEKEMVLLTTSNDRLEIIKTLGVDVGVIEPFTKELANLSARAFLEYLQQYLNIKGLVVGENTTLGKSKTGDIEELKDLSEKLEFALVVVELEKERGEVVSSSALRQNKTLL